MNNFPWDIFKKMCEIKTIILIAWFKLNVGNCICWLETTFLKSAGKIWLTTGSHMHYIEWLTCDQDSLKKKKRFMSLINFLYETINW